MADPRNSARGQPPAAAAEAPVFGGPAATGSRGASRRWPRPRGLGAQFSGHSGRVGMARRSPWSCARAAGGLPRAAAMVSALDGAERAPAGSVQALLDGLVPNVGPEDGPVLVTIGYGGRGVGDFVGEPQRPGDPRGRARGPRAPAISARAGPGRPATAPIFRRRWCPARTCRCFTSRPSRLRAPSCRTTGFSAAPPNPQTPPTAGPWWSAAAEWHRSASRRMRES